MLYELIAVVRANSQNAFHEVKEIAHTAGVQIISGGGVVRGISNWGVFMLPKPMTKHQVRHRQGHYFIMRFDSSARTQHGVRRTLGLDPRVLRKSIVNIGSTLHEIKAVDGVAEWPNFTNNSKISA